METHTDAQTAEFLDEAKRAAKRVRLETSPYYHPYPSQLPQLNPAPLEGPLLAMSASESSGGSVLIPRPTMPIVVQDVDAFLYHFAVVKGLSIYPGDVEKSNDAVVDILKKWNSVYTIAQDPSTESAEAMGENVGRSLANRAITMERQSLLKPLYDYFEYLNQQAETNMRAFTNEDMEEYKKHGHVSWVYMQVSQQGFACKAKEGIVELSKIEAAKQQEKKKAEKAKAEMEAVKAKMSVGLAASKAVENRGGIVFGSGGGARGGFDFTMDVQVSGEFTFGKGGDGGVDDTS